MSMHGEEAASAGCDVLVVDDDAETRDIIADVLRTRGSEVEEARDGSEALAAMRELTPGLVLLDLVMPGLVDGWGVLRHVERDVRLREIPVCVLTGVDAVGLPLG